ncbi:unnamed protein product [Caenorhabditis bovis]|uniref:RRM domain-containing protein n=1 Tax=Caenorhabditis bovis TaxID=2654633 RepID=A0A8S1FAF1_9PELO|nr:unnamed protein product [Caenorhabditis bovis]
MTDVKQEVKQEVVENTNGAENGAAETPAPANNFEENEDYKKLISLKVKPPVAEAIVEIYQSGLLSPEDFDERAIEMINSITVDQAKYIFKEIAASKLFGVSTKSLYVTSLIRSFKDRVRQQGAAAVLSGKLIHGPDQASLEAILARTGYPIEVTIGQRKYGGPPPDWDGPATGPSGQGHEIYVGHIPTELFEDTLIPLFEQVGKIWDLRLMMDPVTGMSRGYAFITFCEKNDAAEAAKKYDGHDILPGKSIKVNVSVANTRLFIGNIPKTKSKDEILEELKSHADGVTDVIIYSVPDNDKIKNRGFCFVDFIDHKTASDVKRKISQMKIRPFNVEVYVDWAEQQEEPDDETMSKVKVLYIRNIKEAVTEEKLTEIFKEFGELERVKKVKDYAFIHFNEREDCLKAMEAWNGKELEGTVVEASLAKPPQDKKKKPMIRGRGYQHGGPGMYGGPRGGAMRGGGGGPGYHPNPYEMGMGWGGGYGGPDMYGAYGGGFGGAYGDYGFGFGFRGARGAPRGMRGFPRGFGNNRRGRGKRPGDGRGGPASKRDNGKQDFSADVNMSTF